ncbi:hypothetical protein QX205_15625 [Acinetobacter pittii]|uniref:hypothetical protein n=1 Tax=Acinetobacter pittii TaxID=48296 RepID=UPI0025B62A28|nr:hypothetical protein [Acinetobacter pittii]MDN4021505.1 hypothetical protein [Acinetobacter pittii]
MANLEVQPNWSSVRQLEMHELARGGLNGNMNEQAKALAERTEYLNQQKASKSEIVQGVFEFRTYADFNVVKTTLPANCTVVIGEENTTGGDWGAGNNLWNGTQLSKSSYDPLQQSKGYTDTEIQGKVLSFYSVISNKFNVLNIVDSAQNSIFRIDENGDIYIFNQPLSLQNNFKEISKELIKLQIIKEISKAVFNQNIKDIMRLNASDGTPVFRISENADIFLFGDSVSIQEKFSKILHDISNLKVSNSSLSKRETSDIFRIDDLLGNPLLRFDEKSKAYLFGMSESIQDLLAKITEVKPEYVPLYAKNPDYLHKKFYLNAGFVERLNHARIMCADVAPVPNFMTFQNFEIGSSWVNDVTLEVLKSSDRVPIDGYQYVFTKDIGVVHPQVWVFNEAVAGYKYWLGINPYTNGNDQLELPFIYGSNDPEFRSWELIHEFPAPFEIDPTDEDGSFKGHLSDSGFTYDVKNGDLIFFWRKNLYYAAGSPVSAKVGVSGARFNGKRWSEKHQIYGLRENPDSGVVEGLMSPNIVYNPADDLYYMYSTQDGKLWYRTSHDLTGDYWSARTECVLSHHAGKIWHLDAKLIGNKLVMLLHSDNAMSASTDSLYFAVSGDFIHFNVSAESILTEEDPSIYKATFQPIFTNSNTVKFRVIYTSDSRTTPQYQLYVTDTNEISIGA